MKIRGIYFMSEYISLNHVHARSGNTVKAQYELKKWTKPKRVF
jgi:hypothetical protein